MTCSSACEIQEQGAEDAKANKALRLAQDLVRQGKIRMDKLQQHTREEEEELAAQEAHIQDQLAFCKEVSSWCALLVCRDISSARHLIIMRRRAAAVRGMPGERAQVLPGAAW
jgi:hypothetical protein